MCILCVVQRWSRRVATMLPWLVLPLILLWALSQLLPPGYRFEITSPRLACVSVLLLTLFWYEILLPQLSTWRARRSARILEQRRMQALELQKLRKTATRRCRNCRAPYRDQNPGGSRFMCSYCGHVSKRPVLDLPDGGSERIGMRSSWLCGQDWPAEWVEDSCSMEKSYSSIVLFFWKLVSGVVTNVAWAGGKLFRIGSTEGSGLDGDRNRAMKQRQYANDVHESRVEKARRKAEEKRQAKLEREMLEEEERKQREEVNRLVEERRKLRDEKLEAEERSKGATPIGDKESRREAEKRRQDKRKARDVGSSKSNSDCEDLERRSSRENEKKMEFDKKVETTRRDSQGLVSDKYKTDSVLTNKTFTTKPKYFSRMTGRFLSSSKGFAGSSFFGRSVQSSSAVSNKTSNPAVAVADRSSAIRKDIPSAVPVVTKVSPVGDYKTAVTSSIRPVSSDGQTKRATISKPWYQLFTPPPVSPFPENKNVIRGSSSKLDAHYTDPILEPRKSPDDLFIFGQSSLFSAPLQNGVGNSTFSSAADATMLQLDPETGFVARDACERPLSRVAAPREITKPSPIESPLSKFRIPEEKHPISGQFSCISPPQLHPPGLIESVHEPGTWHLWSSPLAQSDLCLTNGHSSWHSSFGPNKVNSEDSYPNDISLEHKQGVNHLNGGTYGLLGAGINGNCSWVNCMPFESLPPDEESLFLPPRNPSSGIVTQEGPIISEGMNTFESSPAYCWANDELVLDGLLEGASTQDSCRPTYGSLLPANFDVQSVWSLNHKDKA